MLIKVTELGDDFESDVWINPAFVFSFEACTLDDAKEGSVINFAGGQPRVTMFVLQLPVAIAQLVYEATHNQ